MKDVADARGTQKAIYLSLDLPDFNTWLPNHCPSSRDLICHYTWTAEFSSHAMAYLSNATNPTYTWNGPIIALFLHFRIFHEFALGIKRTPHLNWRLSSCHHIPSPHDPLHQRLGSQGDYQSTSGYFSSILERRNYPRATVQEMILSMPFLAS